MLDARGLRPKKKLGQHFLMDGGAIKRIAALFDAAPGDVLVEVGAGTGALTERLVASGARVTAIELDADLVEILRAREDLRAATILCADALAVNYREIANGGRWIAGGNLPYNVATPLLLGWLEADDPPARIVAMVQKDVADRFVAKPGTPAYGSLTLAVAYRMSVRRAFTLGPQAFYPRPKVDSAVVVMDLRERPAVDVNDPAFMLKVVRGAFAYRRKTLANSLALALNLDRARVQASLERLAIDTEIRGEQLDLDAFAALAQDLAPGIV